MRRQVAPARHVRASLLIALACAGLAAAAEPAPLRVRFIAPAAGDVLLGPTEISLDVTCPEGLSILKVELFADDRLIGTLLDPPWRHTWDAGDTLRSRTLRAKVYASEGRTAFDRIVTRALAGAQKANVTLVEVYATVRDEQGGYLMDLAREDFTVQESGRTQQIAVFSAERKPAHIALVLDTSASMRQDGRIDVARQAAAGFIDALEPADTAALIVFNSAPSLLVERTSDKARLTAAVSAIEAVGGTALYDALVAAADLLKEIEGRKAIILLSDGRDESVDGMGPGSAHTFEEALETVLQREIAVYAIGTGERLEEEPDYLRHRTVGEILNTLATRTGGRAYFVRKAGKLDDAYRRIEDELRHQYTLAYYPGTEPSEGKAKSNWRPITVKVSRPRARVTAREGYYAK